MLPSIPKKRSHHQTVGSNSRTSRCKPRQAILRLGPCRSATVQGAASVALVRGSLAGRAFAGLGPAPLTGPIGAKAKIVTLLKPTFWHLKTYRRYGVTLYPIIGGGARIGWLGFDFLHMFDRDINFLKNL